MKRVATLKVMEIHEGAMAVEVKMGDDVSPMQMYMCINAIAKVLDEMKNDFMQNMVFGEDEEDGPSEEEINATLKKMAEGL